MADLDALAAAWGEEWGEAMSKLYPLLLGRAYRDAEATLGLLPAFDLDNPHVQTAYTELTGLVKRVAETTHAEIVELTRRAAAEGWSVDDLADAILALGEERKRERAIAIARTESASAYTKGSLAAYRASGVVTGKEWLVTRPCPKCDPLGGKIVGLEEDFDNGAGWTGEGPPLHARCRCSISPVLTT